MIIHALMMAVCGAGAWLWLGARFAGSIRTNEQLGAALLVMFLLPVF
jgi:hypothetical protein